MSNMLSRQPVSTTKLTSHCTYETNKTMNDNDIKDQQLGNN